MVDPPSPPVLLQFHPPAAEGGDPIEVDPTILQNMVDLWKVRGSMGHDTHT